MCVMGDLPDGLNKRQQVTKYSPAENQTKQI